MQNGMNTKVIWLGKREIGTAGDSVRGRGRGRDSDYMPIAIRHVKSNKSGDLIYLFAFICTL